MKFTTQFLFVVLLIITANLELSAATVTWDGGAGTNNWMDPANWDTNTIPAAADDVDLNGSTVVLSLDTTVQRIYAAGSSDFTINVGVTLTITGFTGNDEGLEVQGSATVINNGTIAISNILGDSADGLYSKGTFTNNGIISIENIGQHGLYVVAGVFLNNLTGSITVTNVGNTNVNGDCVYVDDANTGTLFGLLNNLGAITVTITSGDDGIYVNDNSTLTNSSTIIISGTGGDNGMRIDDGGVFNNNTGGSLTINATIDDQLFLDNDGSFNNTGTINLNNSPDIGLYVTDASIFTNNSDGIVNITSSSNYSIQIDANDLTANIVNNGTISITGGSNDGIRLQEKGIFNNNATLNINNPGDEGIQIDDALIPVSTFNNNGAIVITSATDHGIENFGTFNNLSGGSYQAINCLDDGIRMRNAGIFNNDGAININGSGSEDIESDDLTFTNTANATYAIGSTFDSGNTGLMEIKDNFDMGNATITFDITGTTAITEFDQIQNFSSGFQLTITNATAELDWNSYIPTIGEKFIIIDGSGDITGEFSSITTTNSDILTTINYSATEVEVEVTNILSIDKIVSDDNLFKIYPNSASDFTHIEFPEDLVSKKKIINLYSAIGELIATETVQNTNTHRINLNNFTSGLYFVTIQIEHRVSTKKLIINR